MKDKKKENQINLLEIKTKISGIREKEKEREKE